MPFSKSRRTSTAPATRQPAAPPMTTSQGPSMMDTVKQGFGLGVGLEAARAAIGGLTSMVSGNSSEQTPVVNNQQQNNQPQMNEKSCEQIINALEKCQAETPNECNPLLDLLKKCVSQ